MAEVQCWCCEHYRIFLDETDPRYIDDDHGMCLLNDTVVSVYDKVCPKFLKASGLFTTRTIPKYCENYSNKKNNRG